MKPRITMNMTAGGELEIWLNEGGRDLLVRRLQALSEMNDHFHMMPSDVPSELGLSDQAYRPTDIVIGWGKVRFRTDEGDRHYFPHVLGYSE
jgi:hypothetical protein